MQTVGKFLEITSADDYFYVNIKRNKECLYLGYNNEVPQELKDLEIEEIYLDFPSEAVGLKIK